MNPIAATDGNGRKCLVLAFVQGPIHVMAVCAYGPVPNGLFAAVPITEFTFDKYPMDWPLEGFWVDEPVPA